MPQSRPYPSDPSNTRWALVEPVLTAWRAERRAGALDIGRPPEHDLRTILNAILYVIRTSHPLALHLRLPGVLHSRRVAGHHHPAADSEDERHVRAGHRHPYAANSWTGS
ncbi:transposase [Nonomuraea sp. NPDC051941]|uniref:transposase n=1 Tax=Nonomuraea sp. NPDC051941 TaxID=3364373 RepID=UPI0037C759D5